MSRYLIVVFLFLVCCATLTCQTYTSGLEKVSSEPTKPQQFQRCTQS